MKRYSPEVRERIIELRRMGCTFDEIQRETGEIPKATLSYICRNVVLPDEYIAVAREKNLATLKKARELADQSRVKRSNNELEVVRTEAKRVVASSDTRDKDKVALAMLYLGEGRKRRSFRGLSLGGSDAATLQIYISLLRNCYGVKRHELRAAVQYRADQNIDMLKAFWAAHLELRADQFYHTSPDPRTFGKPTKRTDYMGVCVITCRGANIQLELSMIAEEYANTLWGYSSAD